MISWHRNVKNSVQNRVESWNHRLTIWKKPLGTATPKHFSVSAATAAGSESRASMMGPFRAVFQIEHVSEQPGWLVKTYG